MDNLKDGQNSDAIPTTKFDDNDLNGVHNAEEVKDDNEKVITNQELQESQGAPPPPLHLSQNNNSIFGHIKDVALCIKIFFS